VWWSVGLVHRLFRPGTHARTLAPERSLRLPVRTPTTVRVRVVTTENKQTFTHTHTHALTHSQNQHKHIMCTSGTILLTAYSRPSAVPCTTPQHRLITHNHSQRLGDAGQGVSNCTPNTRVVPNTGLVYCIVQVQVHKLEQNDGCSCVSPSFCRRDRLHPPRVDLYHPDVLSTSYITPSHSFNSLKPPCQWIPLCARNPRMQAD
jgi:hypothetical protein